MKYSLVQLLFVSVSSASLGFGPLFLSFPFLCLPVVLNKVFNKVYLLLTGADTVSVYTTNSCPASLFISLCLSVSL